MGQHKSTIGTGPQRMHTYSAIPNVDGKVHVIKTGNQRFDDFLSRYSGFIRGTSMFLTGTPGAGKTTLSVFLQSLLSSVKTVLYSREMMARDVQRQCSQYKVDHGSAFIADADSCPTFNGFMAMLERNSPDVVIIDSLQVIATDFADSMGEEAAIKHIIARMRRYASEKNAVVIFIGQMNKDGTFAGPQSILQLADAHMEMTYLKKSRERILSWGGKNRNSKDPSETMYYTLGEGEIRFYSPAEWNIEKNKLTFAQFMQESAYKYLEAMKRRDGYKDVRKKLKAIEASLNDTNMSDEEFLIRMTQEISSAVATAWPQHETV